MVGTYLVVSFVLSLRGNEGFMIVAGGLVHHLRHGIEDGEEIPYCIVPLMVRFKKEVVERCHLMMATSTTCSDFNIRT